VAIHDQLEEKIEALQSEVVESQIEKSELLKNISQLTSSLNQANDRLENQQDTICGLQASLSKVEKMNSALTVQLEHALNDAKKLESQLTELSERYESTCIKLTESSTKLQSMTEALDNSEHKLSTVQDENTDLLVNYRILESKLHESQSNIAELKHVNHELEKQLTYFLEETDSICDAVNDSSSGH
jgi:chromosome segregation ATPase